MSDPTMIEGIQAAVTIPVMAKARIGHFVEAQVLEALEVDYIDESEVLTPADEANHIDKWAFKVPFVCGATNLGEALRRIAEGAAMIRTKGEAGTGNVVEAVRHMRADHAARSAGSQRSTTTELPTAAKDLQAPLDLVRDGRRDGQAAGRACSRAGGIATPADAALMMQLGAEGVFVGSGIFKSEDPERTRRARSSRRPRTSRTPSAIAAASRDLGAAMPGIEIGRARASTAACCSTAAGSRSVVGVLALQGDFEAHARMLESARRRGARGAHARPTSTGSTGWSSPAASRPR